jgi:hypothetical protein
VLEGRQQMKADYPGRPRVFSVPMESERGSRF